MTRTQSDYLKNNWLTLANLVVLLTLSFRVGVVLTSLEEGIKANEKALRQHEIDESVHMPFEKKIEVFVPRVELNSRLETIAKQLDRIEKKLD